LGGGVISRGGSLFHFLTIELNFTSRPPDGLDVSEKAHRPVLSVGISYYAMTQPSQYDYTCHQVYKSNARLAGSKPTPRGILVQQPPPSEAFPLKPP